MCREKLNMMGLCRLCSSTEKIFDVFHSQLENGEQLRLYILLATGIQIKRTDIVSKMVCHRCCEIAVKLHKYRTNAVANDKLLKEQHGQPYTAPITDQEELLRVSSTIANEHTNACNGSIVIMDGEGSLNEALQLLNISIKTEVDESPAQSSDGRTLPQSSVVTLPVLLHGSVSAEQMNDSRFATRNGIISETNTTIFKNDKIAISTPNGVTQRRSSILPRFTGAIKRNVVIPKQCKSVAKPKYKHPSVQKFLKAHKDVILPEEVFKSDINPVISLDSAEVSDWQKEHYKSLQRRLMNMNIVIKKVPNTCNNYIISPPIASIEKSATTDQITRTSSAHSATSSSPHSSVTSLSKHSIISSPEQQVQESLSKRSALTSLEHRVGESSARYSEVTSVEHRIRGNSSKYTATTSSKDSAEPSPVHRVAASSSKPSAVTSSAHHTGGSSSKHNAESSSAHRVATSVSKHNPVITPKYTVGASSKQSETTPQEYSVVTSSTKTSIPKRQFQRIIVNSSDYDSDFDDRGEYEPFISDHQKENDIPQTKTVSANILPVNQQEETAPKNSSQNRRAKKRTAKRSQTTSRKRAFSKDDDTTEIIPEKKKRIYCNKNSLSASNKVDLPKECPSDKKVQKAIFTSSLELEPVGAPLPEVIEVSLTELIEVPQPDLIEIPQPELIEAPLPELIDSGLRKEIFLCPICNNVYDTKKELIDHEKIHLTCKFCKQRLRNLKSLTKHQNESCYINIVKNQPILKVEKVDCVPSIVEKYAEAFKVADTNKQVTAESDLNCNEDIDYGKSVPNIEQVVLPMPWDNLYIENEEAVANPYGGIQSEKNSLAGIENADNNQTKNLEIVCISDDDDDDVQCMEIPRHKIVENSYVIAANEPAASTSKIHTADDQISALNKLPLQNNLSETEMLRSLFKKHSYSAIKSENSTQTFAASSSNIRYTNTNLIILENMFSELFLYKIPVLLESQSRISVRFKEGVTIPPKPTLECWAHKRPVKLQRPGPTHPIRPPQMLSANPTTITLTKLFNDSLVRPRITNSLSALPRSIPNAATAGVNTTYNTTSVSLTGPSTPVNSLCNATSTPNMLECALNRTPQYGNSNAKSSNYMQPRNTIRAQQAGVFSPNSTSTKVVASQNTTAISYQAPIVSHNTSASAPNTVIVPYQSPSPSRNNASASLALQVVEPRNTAVAPYQASATSHTSTIALESIQALVHQNKPEEVHINNNITQVNQFYLLPDNIQLSNLNFRYENPLLKHVYKSVTPPTYDQFLNSRAVESSNQELNVATSNTSVQPVQNNNNCGGLRVKNMAELK